MRIEIIEIEANAEELKTCNTLSQNLNMMLTRAFSPVTRHVVTEDDEEIEDDEETSR